MDTRQTALAALGVAIFAGATAAVLIRWSHAPSVTQVFYRLLFTTAFVAPVAVARDREAFSRLSTRDFAISLVTGVVLGAHFVLFFRSVEWTTVAAATTLTQVQALLVPVAAWVVLDERITRRMVAGIVVAFCGVAVISAGGLAAPELLGGKRPLLGDALALLAAVGFVGYTIAGRSVRQRLPLFPYVTIVYGMATLAVGVFAVGTDVTVAKAFPLREWLVFLGLAIGPGLGAHTLMNWALEHIESSVVSATFLGIPVLSTLLAAVALGEIPSVVTVAGGAVVLAGIYLTSTGAPENTLE